MAWFSVERPELYAAYTHEDMPIVSEVLEASEGLNLDKYDLYAVIEQMVAEFWKLTN